MEAESLLDPFALHIDGREGVHVVGGNVIIGAIPPGISERFMVTDEDDADFVLLTAGGGDASTFQFYKSEGTIASPEIVVDDDVIGTLAAYAHDGAQWQQTARIQFEIDGVSGAGDMPSRIILKTTADGTVNMREVVRIDNAGNFSVGTIAPSYRLSIGSADGSDQIGLYHDNSHAYMKWTDGELTLQTDEGTDTITYVKVKGKGNARAFFQVYDENAANRIEFMCTGTHGYLRVEGAAPGVLQLQNTASNNIQLFSGSLDGDTKRLNIFGFRAGDIKRILSIGVGVDAADTVSFAGLGNYNFAGRIYASGDVDCGGDANITGTVNCSSVVPSNGWSGSFLDQDGYSVNVENGIITDVS